MTRPAMECPNCGALIVFRWSSSVQTTCEHCRSILVRTDVNLELVGVVADLPLDSSPIQIGTEGIYENRAFQVAGRIIYSYAEGTWNEWYLMFSDGTGGWLSDAQSRYAITFRAENESAPQEASAELGKTFRWRGIDFTVVAITLAQYRGVQGELPFEYWDKKAATFVDLGASGANFATLDYSDSEAVLYLGEMVDFDSLGLRNLREMPRAEMTAGSPSGVGGPKASGLNCPGCGAALTIVSEATVSVVCGHCHSILDARDPTLRILQGFKRKTEKDEPLIPLGSSGKWRGAEYAVIGFQRRTGENGGVTFYWREYVLYNANRGYRYLTESNYHWNDATPLDRVPEKRALEVKYLGTRYRHFQEVSVRTTFVLGEFPWQVRVGDSVRVTDYIAPPQVLSREEMGRELTWTLGEYVSGKDIWEAFGLEGVAPAPEGVFENQPSPVRATNRNIWLCVAGCLALLLLILILNESFAQKQEVFSDHYSFKQEQGTEASFVTPDFELQGRMSNVEVKTIAALEDQWIYLNYALINAKTGQAYDFGREVSYYSGTDSDGFWSEGSRTDTVLVPSIPSGTYYLRVEPESEAGFGAISYSITLTRDVPSYEPYLWALGAILIPAVLISWRIFNFEQMRWADSDHPKTSPLEDMA